MFRTLQIVKKFPPVNLLRLLFFTFFGPFSTCFLLLLNYKMRLLLKSKMRLKSDDINFVFFTQGMYSNSKSLHEDEESQSAPLILHLQSVHRQYMRSIKNQPQLGIKTDPTRSVLHQNQSFFTTGS